MQPVGVLTDGGVAWSSGGFVGRGGRDVVEDGDDDAGHQSPRQEWLRDHGGPGKVSAKENSWLQVWWRRILTEPVRLRRAQCR